MGYTKTELIEKLEAAAKDMATFYKAPFINYGSTTTDTDEYYNEIVCAWILNHLTILDTIPMITREACYVTPSHDGTPQNAAANAPKTRFASQVASVIRLPPVTAKNRRTRTNNGGGFS